MVRHAIGIDLGGTSVKYAVVASSGEVLFNGQLPALAQESSEAVLGQILKGVEACREYAAGGGLTLAGVGIGTPGVVSADGRTVLGGAENIAGWENVPLADRIEQAAGLKTLAGNDADMMALGETLFGAAKGASDVVFVTVGTGIGCGVLIGGRLSAATATAGWRWATSPSSATARRAPAAGGDVWNTTPRLRRSCAGSAN